MMLWGISALMLLAALALQTTGVAMLLDVVAPVMTGVGLAVPRLRALAWAVIMSTLWSPLTSSAPLVLIGIWCGIVLVLRGVARGVEWQQPIMAFGIAAAVSLSWQACAWLAGLASGVPLVLSHDMVYALVVRPLTSGALFVALFQPIMACVRVRPPRARVRHAWQ
jgi:hypothetical protein